MIKQKGVVLIVSLVILLVVTLLGTAAMQGTGLEFKMAKNTSERQRVFQASEGALRRVEEIISNSVIDLDPASCSPAANCFENTCAGGLCFFGTNSSSNQALCDPVAGAPAATPIWLSSTIWQNTATHQAVTVNNIDVKYIVEFRCYIRNSSGGNPASNNGDAFYRITVLGESDSGRLQVMLQSTYGVPT